MKPESSYAHNHRGLAYHHKGKYDRAITDYDKAIQLDPKNAVAYSNRGLVYADKNQYDRAIKDYDQAIQLNPNLAEAYHNRGNTYDDMGQYDRAIKDFSRAVQLDPKHVGAYYDRASIYLKNDQREKAILDLRKVLAIDPNHSDAKITLKNLGVQSALSTELKTPDFRLTLPGTWTERPDYAEGVVNWDSGDRNYAFFEATNGSLLLVRIFPERSEWGQKEQDSFLEQMKQKESFWGKPAHPTFARLLTNVFYMPPEAYNTANSPRISKIYRGQKAETLYIWEFEGATGNAHLFYMSQITPRIAVEWVGNQLNFGEE